jgi:hypothetical protein
VRWRFEVREHADAVRGNVTLGLSSRVTHPTSERRTGTRNEAPTECEAQPTNHIHHKATQMKQPMRTVPVLRMQPRTIPLSSPPNDIYRQALRKFVLQFPMSEYNDKIIATLASFRGCTLPKQMYSQYRNELMSERNFSN